MTKAALALALVWNFAAFAAKPGFLSCGKPSTWTDQICLTKFDWRPFLLFRDAKTKEVAQSFPITFNFKRGKSKDYLDMYVSAAYLKKTKTADLEIFSLVLKVWEEEGKILAELSEGGKATTPIFELDSWPDLAH